MRLLLIPASPPPCVGPIHLSLRSVACMAWPAEKQGSKPDALAYYERAIAVSGSSPV